MVCPFESTKPDECWCGRTLTGRQRKYCSPAHRRALVTNHRWTQAKTEAKKAGTYVLCSNAAFYPGERQELMIEKPALCEGFTQHPEVDHIVPCDMKHGVWGCHHHQDNLRVLCSTCHKKVTAKQATERARKRKEGKK